MTDDDILSAATFFARHSGRSKPDASDFRAVAKALAARLAEAEGLIKSIAKEPYALTHLPDDLIERIKRVVDNGDAQSVAGRSDGEPSQEDSLAGSGAGTDRPLDPFADWRCRHDEIRALCGDRRAWCFV
jgi:hypothetical protein